ncbi:unnamed protein product [Closterium sp. Naga37s-1]|nr:unnamed protein product [Closterium sp. Naga37s-1]
MRRCAVWHDARGRVSRGNVHDVEWRHVDTLQYTSFLAVLLAVVFVMITVVIAAININNGTLPVPSFSPDFSSANAIMAMFSVIPIMATAYVCHFNVHPIYVELQERNEKTMLKITRYSMTLCTIVYLLTSISGYLLFGASTANDVLVNFDRNLGIENSDAVNDIVRITYIFHLIFVFPVIFYSLRNIVDDLFFPNAITPLVDDTKRFWLSTAAELVLIYIGATVIPNMTLAFNITGATTTMIVGMLIPAMLALSESAAWEVETGIVPGVNSGNGTVGGFCPLTSLNVTKIFSVMEMDAPKKGSERPTKTVLVPVPGAGFYGVYMVNCAPTRLLSAHVSLSLYNTNPGAPANAPPVKYYLSAGTIALAFVHAICGLTCLAVLCAWLAHVLKIWFHTVVPLTFHLFLTALLPALGALFFALAARLFVQQSAGSSPGIDFAADVLFVVCMALLLAAFFTGIGSIDPYMSDLERVVLFFAVPAAVVSLLGLSLVSPDSLSFVVSTSVTSSASSSAAVTGGSMLTSSLLPDTLPSFTVVISVIRPLLFFLLAAAVAVITLLLFLALLLSCLQCLASRRPGANSSGGNSGMKRVGGGGSSYALDDRDTDGPLEKFYVQACALLLLAGAVSVLLRWCLPYDLVTWLPQALWQAALVLLLVWVLHRFRPRAERSVYQLFDENDVMDEELSEL